MCEDMMQHKNFNDVIYRSQHQFLSYSETFIVYGKKMCKYMKIRLLIISVGMGLCR